MWGVERGGQAVRDSPEDPKQEANGPIANTAVGCTLRHEGPAKQTEKPILDGHVAEVRAKGEDVAPGVRLVAMALQAGQHKAGGDVVVPPEVTQDVLAEPIPGTVEGMIGNGPRLVRPRHGV